MDGNRFDTMARAWGAARSRRGALRLLAAGAIGAALGLPARRAAADHKAYGELCSCPPDRATCPGHCVAGLVCNGTRCRCKPPTVRCRGVCIDAQTDPDHCGECPGVDCPAAPTNGTRVCRNGACGFRCATGHKRCGQGCIPTAACCTEGGPGCPAGKECVAGACVCTAGSCPSGCCAGATCNAGTANEFCGASGNACTTCRAGQRCVGGACVCDSTSCPDGCCDGTTCRAGTTDGICGRSGANCINCTANGLDCDNGVCTCVPNGNCAGCCTGVICRDGTSDGFCGVNNGGVCVTCPTYQWCNNGTCVDRACGFGGPCLVFVTSTSHAGDLGGVTGADAICRAWAAWNGLPGAGTYLAWLSSMTTSPAARFHRSTGPYRLVTGTKVADDWTDLTDGGLDAAINIDETGTTSSSVVWSGTLSNGTVSSNNHCNGWTSSASTISGLTGVTTSTGGAWTDNGASVGCNAALGHFYCFQQG